ELAAPEKTEWVQGFSESAFWQQVFRWEKSRTLDHNPVAWLQEYSWTARLTKWGWCLCILIGEFVILQDWNDRALVPRQLPLIGVLSLAIAFSSVGSFRRERQSGLL